MVNEDLLRKRLELKKSELIKRQKEFIVFFEVEKDSDLYERNAINDLLIMMQLKNEIKELEFTLQLR